MEPIKAAAAGGHAVQAAAGSAAGHAGPAANKKGESRTGHWEVGNVKITSIMESAERIPWAPLFPAETAERCQKYDWLVPRFVTPEGQIILAVQAFVIEAGGRRIVVDTCVGNDKSREIPHCTDLQTAFLKDLKVAGIDPRVHRYRPLHPSALRPRRLEHTLGKWSLGAHLSQGSYFFGRREWEEWKAGRSPHSTCGTSSIPFNPSRCGPGGFR